MSTPDLPERQALMVLCGLPDFGPITVRRLQHAFPEITEALKGDRRALVGVLTDRKAAILAEWWRYFDLEREEQRLARAGAWFVLRGEPDYPPLLAQLPDAPAGLYVRGPHVHGSPAVALVGTRNPTAYGVKVAREFGQGLAQAGVTVVSGLARGIDTEAHRAVLEVGGKTVGVLGCGIDVVYPSENQRLFAQMEEVGGLISEFPCGRPADRQTFPQRNRLISGMCEVVVVIESGDEGGSLITARFAGEQGRQVFAVPGRVDSAASAGCHQLIRDGATLVTSVHEILAELGAPQLHLTFGREADKVRADDPAAGLEPQEATLLGALPHGEALHPDHLSDRLQWQAHEVSASLMLLELHGLVAKRPDGTYERA